MTQGSQVYNQLSMAISKIMERLSNQKSELSVARKEETELNKDLSDHYKRLAEFYLAEIEAARLDMHFDSTASKVAEILDQRDKKKTESGSKLAEMESAIQSLEAKRQERIKERDGAADAYEIKMVQVREVFIKTDEYLGLQSELETLKFQHEKASERLEETSADREIKRKPYEADKIFIYLQKANHGTPRYQKRGFTRLCDGWLADFINYGKANKNYQLLLAIPDRLAEHVNRLKGDFDKAQRAIDDCIEKRFSADGGLPLRKSLDRCEEELQETVEEISEKREQTISLQNFVTDSEAGVDDYTRQAFDLQRQALEADTITDLWHRAQGTETDSDDNIVKSIGHLRKSVKDNEFLVAKGRRVIIDLQKRYADISRLLREFQRRDWDSSYSSFNMSIPLTDFVRDLVDGNVKVDQAVRKLAKAQRFKYRHTKGGWANSADILLRELQRNTRFPSSGGRGGGFGGFGGGFRGGGGFGGGGFSTGGGF